MLADLATQIGKNQLMRSAAIRRWRLRRPRSVAKDIGSDEFLRLYAFASLDLLLEHVGTLDGRSVLEIGPATTWPPVFVSWQPEPVPTLRSIASRRAFG